MSYLQAYLSERGFVPSAALVIGCYVLLRGVRHSMWRVALLALPGTLAHELMHWIVGLVLGARPYGFSVWPKPHGRGWQLGSVSFRHLGMLNGAWVALAPLFLLPLAWLGLVHILVPLWTNEQWGWWLAAGYLIATVLFAALPSLQDIRVGWRSLLLYAAVGGALWWGYAHI